MNFMKTLCFQALGTSVCGSRRVGGKGEGYVVVEELVALHMSIRELRHRWAQAAVIRRRLPAVSGSSGDA
ncbi:hypothetical protein O3P69_012748 [Scylla paramamosain]|uniref:Uncharacterized protein n=1 Tax=Scylla paramamosain TaxID=85552 RepID=A0AAW0SDW5_SCYPA